MHVAIFAGSLTMGGTERVVVNLIDYLIERGDRVTLVTQQQGEKEYPLNPEAKRYILALTSEENTGSRIGNIKARNNKLKNIWRERKPDVILSFIGKCNFMAIETGRPLGIPVAICVRALPELEYDNFIMRLRAGYLFPKANLGIFQTKEQMKFFSKKVQNKSVVLKNPMNEVFFEPPFEGEREKVIVTVGRVDANKNHKMIIDAFDAIKDEFPEWKVVIYGEGDKRKELIEYTKMLGISDRVTLPGNVENVAERIKKTGVFVLSSDTEGSPNALIEAMLLGLPVISTDCPSGGPGELIEDGVNGMLIPVGETSVLQEKLQNLLNNLQLQKAFSEKSLATRDIYSRKKVLGEWKMTLENLVNTVNKG